jgi:hypothetical protein
MEAERMPGVTKMRGGTAGRVGDNRSVKAGKHL